MNLGIFSITKLQLRAVVTELHIALEKRHQKVRV
ncbi:hypothetical protein LINPERPRIM_LOCUS9275 [Linum perenne]